MPNKFVSGFIIFVMPLNKYPGQFFMVICLKVLIYMSTELHLIIYLSMWIKFNVNTIIFWIRLFIFFMSIKINKSAANYACC